MQSQSENTQGYHFFTRLIRGYNDIKIWMIFRSWNWTDYWQYFLFMKITKDDGSPYEPSTIKSFQSSISRHLIDTRNICIITDRKYLTN